MGDAKRTHSRLFCRALGHRWTSGYREPDGYPLCVCGRCGLTERWAGGLLVESSAQVREPGWYVIDHERDDRVLRGPYDSSTTAAAVRREMERDEQWDDANLWIVPASHWEDS